MAMNPGSAAVLPAFRPETHEIPPDGEDRQSPATVPPPSSQNSALNSEVSIPANNMSNRSFSNNADAGAGYETREQQETRKANDKLKRLQETEIAPTTLRYIRKDRVVMEMEDQYYREDAGRFRSFLRVLFTWFLQIGVCMLTLVDIVYINLKSDLDDHGMGEMGSETHDMDLMDHESWRQTNEQFIEKSMTTIILRVLLWQPLVIFGCSFFKKDSYFRHQNYLAGAFCVLGLYPLTVIFTWRTVDYGQSVVFLILLFYMNPLRTFTVSSISFTYCTIFFALCFWIGFYEMERDGWNCRNDGYAFRCTRLNHEDEEESTVEKLMKISQPCAVIFFTVALASFISFRREKVLRKNFKTVQTSLCQTEIMRLATEQNQTMLQSMLPQEMIEKFKTKDSSAVVDTYNEVTVLFCILDDFVTIARSLEPENLLFLLNVLYSEFDKITEETGVYKIETVGEVFMGCAGCPSRIIDHADKAASCALAMIRAMPNIRRNLYSKMDNDAGKLRCIQDLQIKIGLNSGKIVAGVLNTPATTRFKVFGDTVNTASRMQSLSLPGKIQVSSKTYQKLIDGRFAYTFSEKRLVKAKGKGELETWFLEKKEDKSKSRALKSTHDGPEERDVKLTVAGKIRAKLAPEDSGGTRDPNRTSISRISVNHTQGTSSMARMSNTQGAQGGQTRSRESSDASSAMSRSRSRSQTLQRRTSIKRKSNYFSTISTDAGEDATERKSSFESLYKASYDDPTKTVGMGPSEILTRRERLKHHYKRLLDRKEPELSPTQVMLTILGTELRAVGKDEKSAHLEAKYVVHKWSTHLKTVRSFQCFWSCFFFFFGATWISKILTQGTLEGEDSWMNDPIKLGQLCHVVNSFAVGLPCTLVMLFFSFKRQFFWKHHQLVMVTGLSIIGISVMFETGAFVPKVGYGNMTMYIMSIYQYQLLFFVNRSLLCLIMCIMYYLMISLFSTDLGNEHYTLGQNSEQYHIKLNNPENSFMQQAFDHAPNTTSWSFQQVGYDTECQTVLQKEAFHYMEDMGLNIGPPFSNYTDMSLTNVLDNFLLKGVLDMTRSPTAYWQIITQDMASQYLVWLLIFTLLLVIPSLMSDYHERVCYNKEVMQATNTELMNKQQEYEEMLLKRLLPPEIVPILPKKRATNEVVADRFNSVSIIFCDMVGFTKFSSDLDPSELMIFLSALYAKYSAVISDNSLYTVEVIGDALLAVAGCPKRIETEDHASRAIKAAFELLEVTKEFSKQIQIPINIRVGVHSGQVIAGVVGMKDPRYHLFGEAVKVVEIMESTGSPDRVHCSHGTYRNLFAADDEDSKNFRDSLEFNKRTDIKGADLKKLEGVDYGGSTYFVKQKVAEVGSKSEKVHFRRLTLGRNDMSPTPGDQKKLQEMGRRSRLGGLGGVGEGGE
ncbi:hypothetical protein TrVE_jg7466 [Triparma verrucosa]|uniref:Guanylate cyclase domain-containing protein n=1 Tax=Triparma verrucosa TaxID=1606542 RepID=A0A9W7CE10_9STRA|nr:hypothetical protein TrVE_jg7466 [Triparma verrucosa]